MIRCLMLMPALVLVAGALPLSKMGKPVDPKADVLVVSLDKDGRFDAAGKALATVAELKAYLKEQRAAKPGTTAIAVRADKAATAPALHDAFRAAQANGFTRAYIQTRRPGGES